MERGTTENWGEKNGWPANPVWLFLATCDETSAYSRFKNPQWTKLFHQNPNKWVYWAVCPSMSDGLLIEHQWHKGNCIT